MIIPEISGVQLYMYTQLFRVCTSKTSDPGSHRECHTRSSTVPVPFGYCTSIIARILATGVFEYHIIRILLYYRYLYYSNI